MEAFSISPKPVSVNGASVPVRKPLIIAGPCSAETPQQLMATARALSLDPRVAYFRAGVWKPRTTPDSFEGVGAKGLSWLQQVRQQTGLKITTEVGATSHVEEALKYGVDMLWIGARTVSNPFAMQEIAEALKGVSVPVMVKNPLSPDVGLWDGALTRLKRAGVQQLGAVHRGFFWWAQSHWRNEPLWHIPLELRERWPHIPMVCDPSHIAGKRLLVPVIAQRALHLGFDGLMTEVHHTPSKAWSDAAQQLSPSTFSLMLDELFNNREPVINPQDLEELRAQVDVLDEMLVSTLSARMDLAGKIARVKRDTCQPTLQLQRWSSVLRRVKSLAEKSGIDPCFVENIFNDIHRQSLLLQDKLRKPCSDGVKKEHNFVG